MKRSAPSFDEAPPPNRTIPFYSDNSLLSEKEWIRLRLVSLTSPKIGEPLQLSQDRSRVNHALRTLEHFRELGIPPIFGAFEFEALCLMEKK